MQGLGQREKLEDQPVMVAVRGSRGMPMGMARSCLLLHMTFRGFDGRGTTDVCMSQNEPVCSCWVPVLASAWFQGGHDWRETRGGDRVFSEFPNAQGHGACSQCARVLATVRMRETKGNVQCAAASVREAWGIVQCVAASTGGAQGECPVCSCICTA